MASVKGEMPYFKPTELWFLCVFLTLRSSDEKDKNAELRAEEYLPNLFIHHLTMNVIIIL